MSNTKMMNARRRRNGRGRANTLANNVGQSMVSHPPQIPSLQVKHSTLLRFVANTAVSQDITVADLLDLILFATSATAVYDLFTAVKIRYVEVWSLPAIGTANTVTVEFDGGNLGVLGDRRTHTDTSMGIQPAHVLAKPSGRSQASQYQSTTSDPIFFLQCPAGSVVDLALTFNGDFVDPVLAQHVAVAASTGAVYLRGLDGLAAASTKLPPANVSDSI